MSNNKVDWDGYVLEDDDTIEEALNVAIEAHDDLELLDMGIAIDIGENNGTSLLDTAYVNDPDDDWNSQSSLSSFHRYTITLEPQDIICGSELYDNSEHPGNITMQQIVQKYLQDYGRATRKSERSTILCKIQDEIKGTQHTSNGVSSRFLFLEMTYDINIQRRDCREATQDEIITEIEGAIRSYFCLLPTSRDVIFGRGRTIRSHPGLERLRAFIDNQRHLYASSDDKQGMVQSTREAVMRAGGRFLLPYNKSRLSDGCIEADEGSVRQKIAHLYRHK